MQVNAVSSNNDNSRYYKADQIKDNFLKLFVAQLKSQDPTNPMDNKDLTQQLAQLSQVENSENIKNLTLNWLNVSGAGLIGSFVTGVKEDGSVISGKVIGVESSSEGPIFYTENGSVSVKELRNIYK